MPARGAEKPNRRFSVVAPEMDPGERLAVVLERMEAARTELDALQREALLLSAELGAMRGGAQGHLSKWLRLREVGEWLGISESQVRALIHSGELPAIRPEGTEVQLRVDLRDVAAYQERSRRRTVLATSGKSPL